MGQKKRDRSTQYKLEIANEKLNETSLELLRRDRENREAEARLEGATDAEEAK